MKYFVEIWLPIIKVIIIIISAFAGLFKYFKEKNREIYEKLLAEVYAPLYQYFVKQELIRKIMHMESDYNESPVLEMKSRTTKSTFTEGRTTGSVSSPVPVLELSRDVFVGILDSINIGLAPKELYTLLSMYKVTIHVCNEGNKTSDSQLESAIMQWKIEKRLRKEIIKGYKMYHKKLGLKSSETTFEIKITNDNIIFSIPVSREEKEELKDKIEKNPELYY